MVNTEITTNTSGHQQKPAWKNASFWHITALMAVLSVFYYVDVIIDYAGWVNLRWEIFYTVHDLHRAFFLIPAIYATYKFRLKGVIIISLISLFVFLPRALAVSPYPNPLLRALIFIVSMVIMGVFLSLLLDNINKRKELEKSLWQAQNDLLRKSAESQKEEALESLQKSTALFANISSQVPGMLYQFMRKPDGTYSVPFSSDGVKDIFGCTPQDVYDNFNPIFQAIFHEDRDKILQTIEESAKSMMQWKCEYRVQLPGKPLRWILGNSIPEKMADGTIVWSGYNTDITGRKQADEALRESEDKYKSLIDNVPDIIFTIDLEGKITFVSKRTKEILGYENAETINMNIFNFIPEEDRQRAMENLQKGMKGEKIKHFQIPLIAKSGAMLFFECSFARIYKDGAVVGAQGTAVEITERKKAEADLAAAQRLYQELFDNVDIGILRTTPGPEGTFIDANPAMIQMFEADSREQLMTLHPSDIYWDAGERKIISDAIVANGFVKEDIKFKSLKGNPFLGQIHSIRKSDINGNTYFDSTVENITERKRMEERLQESEKLYRSLFDGMLNAFQYSKMIFDQGTPVDYIYLDVNRAFESLTGLRDVIGRKVSEVLPGILQSDPELFDILAGVSLSGNPEKFDIYVKALNQWFSASAYSHAKEYFVVIFEDISERKQAEEGKKIFSKELEQRVAQRTAELKAKTDELERINKIFVDRELRMRELKERITELEKQKT